MQKPHILIVTPAYDGKVHIPYALALSDTCALLRASGVEVSVKISSSGSLLVAERNRLTELFWQSDATHMLCIDSDLGWPAEAVPAMLAANKEFIAGVYPARKTGAYVFRPQVAEDGTLVCDGPLIKTDYLPAGFMLISKSAVKKMRDKFPELYYAPKHAEAGTESTYCFFNTEVWQGEFWGEDYVFCRKAREAGVDIWVDPQIGFDHAGKCGALIEQLTPATSESTNNETV